MKEYLLKNINEVIEVEEYEEKDDKGTQRG